MAPVRARIPSSSVVLPLWNGPTSAMHRGPVARVPFCAIFRLRYRSRRGPPRDRLNHRFRPKGDWQEASASHEARRNRRDMHLSAKKKRPPRGRPFMRVTRRVRSRTGAQMQFRNAEGEIEPHRGADRDRRQADRAVRAADENVGAEPGGDRDLTARAEIVAGEKSGSRRRDAVREYCPHHDPAAGGADIESELADRAVVDLLRAGRLRREGASDRLLRTDDEAHAGGNVASQDAGSHPLGHPWIGGPHGQCKRCCPDSITKHMDPPFARSHKPGRVAPRRTTLRKIAVVKSSCRRSAGCAGTLPPRPRSWSPRRCERRDRNRTAYLAPLPRPRPPTIR